MKTLRTAAIAAATTVAMATTAFASTVNVMGVDGSGDTVSFMVTNNSSQAVRMLTLDVSQHSAAARLGSRFNMGKIDHLTGAPAGTTADFFQPIGNQSPQDYQVLKITFGGDGLGTGETVNFDTWVQFLRKLGRRDIDGLSDRGERLFGSVMFVNGTSGSGFFTDRDGIVPGSDTGKATLDVAPVPLPASAALMLAGLAGLGGLRARKKAA